MAKTYSCLLVGLEIVEVEIETIVGVGFSGLNILGLKSDIARDMKERIRSALEFIGIPIPAKRVVANVCSNELFKLSRTPLQELDFAVAASVIMALYEDQGIQLKSIGKEFFAGELTLSGQLKPPQNLLIYEKVASLYQVETPFLIALNANQAQTTRTMQEFHANFLSEHSVNFESYAALIDWLQERRQKNSNHSEKKSTLRNSIHAISHTRPEESQIQRVVKTIQILLKNPKACIALLIAAAGNHHILLAGEPGVGKSYSISQIQHLFTTPSVSEQIEIKLIHANKCNSWERPFRVPHHSASLAALIGGQSLKPGEVTLAHNGVLLLDEIAEFSRNVLEALREPLDSEKIELSKALGSVSYPAKFLLCATTNPCPCGYYLSNVKTCRCLPHLSRNYLAKLSGPLLDRFCMQLWLENPNSSLNESSDLFSEYLLSLDSHSMFEFAKHFLTVQLQLRNNLEANKIQFKNMFFQKEFEHKLSLRAQNKIQKLANTFHCVFPQFSKEKNFSNDILQYRNFSQKIDKDIIYL